MKIFYSLKAIIILVLLNTSLSLTKSANLTIIDLNHDFINQSYNSEMNFSVSTLDGDLLPNYLKIEVNSSYGDIAISYYERDDKFKERKQLSYGHHKVFMWLNKNQIKNNFYFNIECDYSICEYNISIYKNIYAELKLGEIYKYYITEKNKYMIFLINIDYKNYYKSLSDESNSKISIWARGSNNYINSKLEPNSYTNLMNDKYQAYLIHNNEITDYKYYLKVEGSIGDLINVGSLIFDGNNKCPIFFYNLGIEITGFFKKDILETNCFKFNNANYYSFNQIIYDFEIENSLDENKLENEGNYFSYICLYYNKKYNYDEYLYSLLYSKSHYFSSNYLFSPLMIGKNYKISIKKGDVIGFIPRKPDKDYNYITYHVKDLLGRSTSTSYIIECDKYPFCYVNKIYNPNWIGKEEFSISYSKNEYNNISPISKSQKILCIEGISSNNLINVNFYTNKNKIFIPPQYKFYKYLRTNNEDNLLINIPYNSSNLPDSPLAFLSLEILSGSVNINFETPKSSYLETIQDNNKKSFIFRLLQKNENLLKIKANKNSYYSIVYILEENNNKILKGQFNFPFGNNFLYEIKNSSSEYFLNFKNTMSYKIYKIYFEFYPINCRIEVENCNNRTKLNQYKDISYYIEKEKNESSFKIRRLNYNNGQSCLFCASSYFSYNSKILIKNIPQYSFVKYNDEIEYLYFHSELGNDLEVTFGTNHPGNNNNASYYIIYLINDSFKTRVNIYYNDSFITIESKKVKKYCRDEKEVCMIKLILYSLYYKESVF